MSGRRARFTNEQGFMLIELVVAMVAGVFIAAAAMTFLIVSLDQQNAVSSRTAAAGHAEVGLEQLVRDLREAMTQDASGNALSATVSTNAVAETTSVAFDVPTPNSNTTPQTITWTCPSGAESSTYVGSCTRTLASGSAQTMIAAVQSVTLTPIDSGGTQHTLSTSTSSSYSNPAAIAITLKVQVASQLDASQTHILRGTTNVVTIQTTADLRNFT